MTIEEMARVPDGAGGADVTWSSVAEVSAALWSRSAAEVVEQDRVSGRATHDIWVRYRNDIKPDMRFRLGARIFHILGTIDVDDRGRWLRCPAEEHDL